MTWLATPFLNLPRWLWGAILLTAAAIAFVLWLDAREDAAVKRDRAAARGEALERAREADERAHGAVQAEKEATHEAVERAKAAADGSDDKLRAALDSLRAGESGADKATR